MFIQIAYKGRVCSTGNIKYNEPRPNIGVFRWSFRRFPHFVSKVVREGGSEACGHYVRS